MSAPLSDQALTIEVASLRIVHGYGHSVWMIDNYQYINLYNII